MWGTTIEKYDLYILTHCLEKERPSDILIEQTCLEVGELSNRQWQELETLYGRFRIIFLRWRYGKKGVKIHMIYHEKQLVYAHWEVPASIIGQRYPFVQKNTVAIIACLTKKSYRGKSICPIAIQSNLQYLPSNQVCWIWTRRENSSSRRSILKSGGKPMGFCERKKRLWGAINHIDYSCHLLDKND